MDENQIPGKACIRRELFEAKRLRFRRMFNYLLSHEYVISNQKETLKVQYFDIII